MFQTSGPRWPSLSTAGPYWDLDEPSARECPCLVARTARNLWTRWDLGAAWLPSAPGNKCSQVGSVDMLTCLQSSHSKREPRSSLFARTLGSAWLPFPFSFCDRAQGARLALGSAKNARTEKLARTLASVRERRGQGTKGTGVAFKLEQFICYCHLRTRLQGAAVACQTLYSVSTFQRLALTTDTAARLHSSRARYAWSDGCSQITITLCVYACCPSGPRAPAHPSRV